MTEKIKNKRVLHLTGGLAQAGGTLLTTECDNATIVERNKNIKLYEN